MRTHSARCQLAPDALGFTDLTAEIDELLTEAGIRSGRVVIASRDPGCAVFLNESETGLKKDLNRVFDRVMPNGRPSTAAVSATVVLPVVEGRLWMGDWQRVLAHSGDGAGELVVQVTGT